jgi:membrane protein implicated in regulation of membrane protease activity
VKNMTLFWLIIFVILIVVEAVTVSLTSIWFAAGALAALISAAFSAPIWLQVIWFIVVSGVTLYFTRPLAKRYLNAKRLATNADRVLESVCIVTEEIDNIAGTGTVSVGGKLWTARSKTGEKISMGEMVKAVSIEGVKLIVVPTSCVPEHSKEVYSTEIT